MRCVTLGFLLLISYSFAQKLREFTEKKYLFYKKKSNFFFLAANIQKCSKNQKDFEKCLIDSAQKVLSLLDKDLPALNLKSFSPFVAGTFTLPAGTKIVQFAQKYNNLRFSGFKDSKIGKSE